MAKLPALPDGWLGVARPALVVGVLAIVLGVGWSGLFDSSGRQLDAAAASTASFARVTASRPPTGFDRLPSEKPGAAQAPPRIIALGDSVMIGAKDRLAARLGPSFSMSAEVGRQASDFVAIAQKLKREGHYPDAMILQLGDNGPLYGDEMDALRRATSKVGELFLVDDHAPVSWIEESNHALAEAARDWPHTTLIEWKSAAESSDGLLWDGIHLTPAGAGVYARLVSGAVHETIPFPPKPKKKTGPPQARKNVAAPARTGSGRG